MKNLTTILIAAGTTAVATIATIMVTKAIKKSKKTVEDETTETSEEATEEVTTETVEDETTETSEEATEEVTTETVEETVNEETSTEAIHSDIPWHEVIECAKLTISYCIEFEKKHLEIALSENEKTRCSDCINILERALDVIESSDDYVYIAKIYHEAMEEYDSIRFPKSE